MKAYLPRRYLPGGGRQIVGRPHSWIMYFTLKMFASPTKCVSPTINPWRRHWRYNEDVAELSPSCGFLGDRADRHIWLESAPLTDEGVGGSHRLLAGPAMETATMQRSSPKQIGVSTMPSRGNVDNASNQSPLQWVAFCITADHPLRCGSPMGVLSW